MSTYARNTKVPVDRSRAAVERVLTRYGATGFGYQWEKRREVKPNGNAHEREYASVIFMVKDRRVRLDIPFPTLAEMGSEVRRDAAKRQRWRAVLLVITAKLEAVESGISTLEAEFLANLVTEDGRTMGDVILPRLTEATKSGRLLPAKGDA